jgi:hypothetical protein
MLDWNIRPVSGLQGFSDKIFVGATAHEGRNRYGIRDGKH